MYIESCGRYTIMYSCKQVYDTAGEQSTETLLCANKSFCYSLSSHLAHTMHTNTHTHTKLHVNQLLLRLKHLRTSENIGSSSVTYCISTIQPLPPPFCVWFVLVHTVQYKPVLCSHFSSLHSLFFCFHSSLPPVVYFFHLSITLCFKMSGISLRRFLH